MKKINTILLDGNDLFRNSFAIYLQEKIPQINVIGSHSNSVGAYHSFTKAKIDLFILSFELKGDENGLEAIAAIDYYFYKPYTIALSNPSEKLKIYVGKKNFIKKKKKNADQLILNKIRRQFNLKK